MKSYDHKKIEKKWQERWNKEKLYETPDDSTKNYYVLVEFPYPSGNLHVGHWYAFSLPDIYARFMRMRGFNTLFPIGFDSFGLPAENAAIKHGLNPREWTEKNIDYMKNQLNSMGTSFDWSREIWTSDPDYYKWTQWFFTEFFKKGIAYQGEATVNWCPSCQTVLANEQVVQGLCERCDTEVEQKVMKQWMLKITDYAERLIDDLDDLDWPEAIKESQKNWVGKKEGAVFSFGSVDWPKEIKIETFTTRPDTFFGVTFLVVSPERIKEWMETGHEFPENVNDYVEKSLRKTERERLERVKDKTGVDTTLRVKHPGTKEDIPVFVADYVLGGYGTGAVMGVPAHDMRDFEFANAYELSVRTVIEGGETVPFEDMGTLIESDSFSGMKSEEAGIAITKEFGKKEIEYRLRDWSISRQRYWGVPIPVVYDKEGVAHPIPKEHLPWTLPEDVDHVPTGVAPLARSEELKKRTEEIFGKGWTPEVETMDTFVDSSWYFLRYLDSKNKDEFASMQKQKQWMPIDFYSGGAEHTTMHLLYSRFFYKVLYDLGLVSEKEPYKRRINRGLILGPDGAKMSKSRGNVIDPDELVSLYGADTVRAYLGFIGPYNEVGAYPWNPNSVIGIRRFIERVWRLQEKVSEEPVSELEKALHITIKKVTEDTESLKFNTAISSMMVFLSEAEKIGKIGKSQYESLIQLLAPYIPHVAEEIWESLQNKGSVHLSSWPVFDEGSIVEEAHAVAVQINGKVRGELLVKVGLSEEEVREAALELDSIQKWITKDDVQKTVYIQGKIINFVVKM